MAIRISILFLLFALIGRTQNIETQRKYRSEKMSALVDFVIHSDSVSYFKTHFHQEIHTTDIYFDTPKEELFNLGLSLRFRRKKDDKNEYVYSLQLKTEMEKSDGVRVEVDEPELDFYVVVLPGYHHPLTYLLNDVFENCLSFTSKKSDELKIPLELSQWFSAKAFAPISPFQKLVSLYPEIFTEEKMSELTPVSLGQSKRFRSHIYIDLKTYHNEFGTLQFNPKSVSEKLVFFETNQSAVWTMESSLDSSIFFSLKNNQKESFNLVEYEVESKYHFGEIAVQLLNDFEKKLLDKFQIVSHQNSKFRQSMLFFNEQK